MAVQSQWRVEVDIDLTLVVISDDASLLDIDLIHREISGSYWAKDIPLETLQNSIDHSICYGAYYDGEQIGFARVITDQTTFAYLADVFVTQNFMAQGVAQKMMDVIMDDERMLNVRRFCLATRDAHSLYEKFGFENFTEQDRSRFMQVRRLRKYS